MAPVFHYIAKNKNGDELKGSIEAESSSMVASQLKEKGYYITSIKEKKRRKSVGEYLQFDKRIKISDLAVFSQQFSVMINAGISLVEALETLKRQTENKKFADVISRVQEDVETGSGLAESMAKYPKAFPDLYCQLISVGEAGGVLDQVLIKLAAHYERQDELNGKVKSALYYPVTILVVAVAVVVFLLLKVVPQFVSMFEGFGAQLPLPTRILLGSSKFIQSYWYIIMLIIAIIAFALYYYKNTPKGEYKFDKLLLELPVLGNMMEKVYISRITSTLAMLLNSGVDLLSSLAIVENVVGNKVYGQILTEARIQVREGVSLSEPLSNNEEFPRMVVQMIKVGEEAGNIGEMLNKISNFFDREVEASVDGAISLIEPVMIVFLAVIVGFVAVSIVTPMFDMFQQF